MIKIFLTPLKFLYVTGIIVLPGFATPLPAQDWTTYTVDKVVTVEAPVNARIVDSVNQTMYLAQGFSGSFLFGNTVNTNSAVPDNKALKGFYAEFTEGFTGGAKGRLLDSRPFHSGKIEGQSIRIGARVNGQEMIIDCRAFLFNDKIYQFQTIHPAGGYDPNDPGSVHFFSSIKFIGDPPAEKQYSIVTTMNSPTAYQWGYIAGQLSIWLVVIGVAVYGLSKLRTRS